MLKLFKFLLQNDFFTVTPPIKGRYYTKRKIVHEKKIILFEHYALLVYEL